MLKKINSHLVEWTAFSPEAKTDLTSHAYISDGKVLIIDPIKPDNQTLKAIQDLGNPCTIFVTSGNHERFSRTMGDLLKVPIAAPAEAIKELSYKPDIIVNGLKQLHGMHPIPLPGGGPGEYAYYCPAKKILFVGDALINLDKTGLTVLPQKYCSDYCLLQESLKKLLDLKIDLVAFAHGGCLDKPLPELKKLLA